jgi:hypothetical protein
MDPRVLISDEYRALITQKHDVRPWGGTGKTWVPLLTQIFNEMKDIQVVLDYGCGRGTLKPALREVFQDMIVHEYDPGVRGKTAVPLPYYDYVVCTDVLEHVEEDKIDIVLEHIQKLAVAGVFFVIVFTPCKSSLPDGRNTHILQRPRSWWDKKISHHFDKTWKWTYHEEGSGRVVMSGQRV